VILKVYDDTVGFGECRSCGAKIVWAQLASGRRHPFDRKPVYVKTEHDEARRLLGHVDTDVTSSHFATCPQAKDWKRS
jgi:hypothetical protein